MEKPMSDLKRLETDLYTLRQAAGWELPFTIHEIYVNFALGAAGIFSIAWDLWPHRFDKNLGLLPPFIVVMVLTLYMQRQVREQVAPARRNRALLIIAMSLAGAVAFGGVCRWYQVPIPFARSMALMLTGGIICGIATVIPHHRYNLPMAIACAAAGVCSMFWPTHWVGFIGASVTIGAPWSALIQLRLLRQHGSRSIE
jgi:hypothetical protein